MDVNSYVGKKVDLNLTCNVPDNKCYKQKWGGLFFTCIKLVACVHVYMQLQAGIKWKRLFHQFCEVLDTLVTDEQTLTL